MVIQNFGCKKSKINRILLFIMVTAGRSTLPLVRLQLNLKTRPTIQSYNSDTASQLDAKSILQAVQSLPTPVSVSHKV